jgi:tRNA dimethylallyltransferase
MDIGSSKPSLSERRGVGHHLIDIVNPDYHFTAGDYCLKASEAFRDITGRGKTPLIVGGTGFYIDSFCNGIDEVPDIDESIRRDVAFEYDNGRLESLYEELKKADPEFASKVHINDRQRVIRGLSVFRDTGKPLSGFFGSGKKVINFDTLFVGLYIDRESLQQRIDLRVDSMIRNGLVEEVEKLREMGYQSSLNSMQSIGYSEINRYIDGLITLEDAVGEIKHNTQKYAKKQMTWFKKNKNVIWFSPDEIKKIPDIIKNWLNKH